MTDKDKNNNESAKEEKDERKKKGKSDALKMIPRGLREEKEINAGSLHSVPFLYLLIAT